MVYAGYTKGKGMCWVGFKGTIVSQPFVKARRRVARVSRPLVLADVGTSDSCEARLILFGNWSWQQRFWSPAVSKEDKISLTSTGFQQALSIFLAMADSSKIQYVASSYLRVP